MSQANLRGATMMNDASEMLAAALEQMDGIIAGSKAIDYSNGLFDCQSPTSPFISSLRALHLLEDLRGALELMDADERDSLRCQVSDTTAEGLTEWLQGRLTNGHSSVGGDLVYQERLSRLESDKECLVLQVSVLTDQVEVQGEQIRDLETCLKEHREKLNSTEELLQQELVGRSTLETQKLELMTEVSSLKLKLTAVERDRRETEALHQEVNDLRVRVVDMENERIQQDKKLRANKEELLDLQKQLEEKEAELKSLHDQTQQDVATPKGGLNVDRDMEVQRMKKVMESAMAADAEKDRKIEELQLSLTCFKKTQDIRVMSVLDRKEKLREDTGAGSLGDIAASVAVEMKTSSPGGVEETDEPQLIPCTELLESELVYMAAAKAATPAEQTSEPKAQGTPESSSDGSLSRSADRVTKAQEEEQRLKSSSAAKASPTEGEGFGSKKARSSFGRGFFKIRGGKRTASAPNLAETERKGTDHLDLAGAPIHKSQDRETRQAAPAFTDTKKKHKGLRKFFGRLRRSQSTSFNLDDAAEGEFRRGGVRATAGPRLGWSRDLQQQGNSELDTPFARWTREQVCGWLQELGLGMYTPQAQHWVQSGQTLLQASQHDLEKELGIKHPLHRKKLQLTLQALGSEEEDAKGKLDYNWVTRWLDDIGLPQYKSHFDEGRVDGRMLHYMTVDDVLGLKVGSVLHHLSIKRAVQVLRLNRYEPNCLRRRPSDENNITPAEICQWTNHRVMEWLRSVDLAEYAPNLRGSGVHGGLMVLEPRFNVETLALLLNIPPNKTLLRRHLATHFHLLIGSEAQRLKQECLENPDYTLLTATAKVKPRRLSFGSFGTLRRKRQEESEEYICPMDVEMPQSSSFHRGLRIYEDELDHLEQMDDSEGTVKQIGAFSEGINNLTSMLKEEEFFREGSPDASATDDDM
ncbi:LOW QUALITY PROTEIN: liprin-beta-1-like [Alosa alosa]|uniref:LOW QUALITY PROTEIN: liprin-beta-1-like n=1 Tax=Alosa alosa TaxID=278164 RepID=UPI00201524B5|nr:LOW QUALITY PROTEIN: liprin-beta-1-like [Alosa alosa]